MRDGKRIDRVRVMKEISFDQRTGKTRMTGSVSHKTPIDEQDLEPKPL